MALRTVVVLAMVFGVFSSLLGLTIAFYANLAAGGAVVLTAVGLLVLVEVGVASRDKWRRARGRATHHST